MKTQHLIYTLSVCMAGLVSSLPASGASSAVLGCQRVALNEGWHLVGPPFEPFAVAQGTVSAMQGGLLSVSGEDWRTN
jgi:hypothetical protein